MARIPLMIMTDSPTSRTGLGRIGRELAGRIYDRLYDTFEVAVLGYGGQVSKELPYQQYVITKMTNWAVNDLPAAWKDFAGDRKGVLLSIWNPSSLFWLADPSKLPAGELRTFLESKPFETWLYVPIDAEGPGGKLSAEVTDTLSGFDRVLAYTKWAANMIDRSRGVDEESVFATDFLPHGIDTSTFYLRDRAEARATFLDRVTEFKNSPAMKDDVFLVGIVGTNSQRKDWALGMEACQELVRRGLNVGLWAHTNVLQKHWDILAMAKAFGLEGRIIPSIKTLSDDDMAMAYSACDCVFGVGAGEGFGYTTFEALACGVPVVTGKYAAAAEIVPPEFLVKPTGWYYEGYYANRRPVFDPKEWATVAMRAANTKAELPAYIDWNNCWEEWSDWLLSGVNGD
jgi:glycosyltransferase involved in cell wall biosynthesis